MAIIDVMADVTQILSQIEQGDPSAAEQLLPLIYDELRKLAAAKLANEKPGQTLQATALVHDAYIRLVDVERAKHWDSRGHFFSAAAEAMRRILVERARQRLSKKRGGDRARLDLRIADLASPDKPDEIVAVDEALELLECEDSDAAQVVKLRFFAGLSLPEIALALGVSLRTTERNWTYARTWLRGTLADEPKSRDL
jgi:RNA polymerase sigma factor (TIGR02999 family)